MDYIIKGTAEVGRETLPFEKEVEAESKKHAREIIYSIYGSKHGINRSKVNIEKIEEK